MTRIGDYMDSIALKIKYGLKGNKGEQMAFAALSKILDENYRVLRNVKIRGRKFDIDAVIVGPKGVVTLEVKNYSGEYQFDQSLTYTVKRYGNGAVCYCQENDLSNPLKEAARHNAVLEEWLQSYGFAVKVRGALFMAGDAVISEIVDPVVYVIPNPDGLSKYIQTLPTDPLFTPEFCEGLVKLLQAQN